MICFGYNINCPAWLFLHHMFVRVNILLTCVFFHYWACVCMCSSTPMFLWRSRFRIRLCYGVSSLGKCCSLLNTFIYFHSLLWSSINHFPPSDSNYTPLTLIYLPLSGSDTPFTFPSPLLSLKFLGPCEGHFSSSFSGEMLSTYDKWRHSDWIINKVVTLPLKWWSPPPFLLPILCYFNWFVAHIVTW